MRWVVETYEGNGDTIQYLPYGPLCNYATLWLKGLTGGELEVCEWELTLGVF